MKSKASKLPDKTAVMEKVRALFGNAAAIYKEKPELADRYVRKARNTAMKSRLQLPPELKKRFCRFCGAFWVPGRTVRVRLQNRKVVYFCLKCKRFTRHPYIREQKARRAARRS